MPTTVKDLAKKWHVTRQAIRARIARTKGFADQYTAMKHHVKYISDDGVKILKQHGNKTSKYINTNAKRLLKEQNIKLKYQIQNYKTHIKDLQKNINDLRHNDTRELINSLKTQNNRLNELLEREQAINMTNARYYRIPWIKRLFMKKPATKEIPANIKQTNKHN